VVRRIETSLIGMTRFVNDNTQDPLLKKDMHVLSGTNPASAAEGVYPVWKPEGVSSFRMVQLVRRILGIKKVGHTGTLDPFASGVLVLCAGRPATRLIPQLMQGDKEYEATLQLGVITDTLDPEGNVIEKRSVGVISRSDIAECLGRFTGEQMQTPPAYSALKHKGKPLYHYARKGIMVVKEPRLIVIKELQCLALDREAVTLKIVCSKGTYIRTLAADIGEFLGCGAHLRKLQRTRNGFFSLAETLPGEKLFSEETGGTLLDSHRIPVTRVKELLAGNEEKN
jgi:tRNA pseudouridine55 synthase